MMTHHYKYLSLINRLGSTEHHDLPQLGWLQTDTSDFKRRNNLLNSALFYCFYSLILNNQLKKVLKSVNNISRNILLGKSGTTKLYIQVFMQVIAFANICINKSEV